MKLSVVIEKGESGFYIAHCPAIKGCHSQGVTEDEALVNIKEAIELCLETIDERVQKETRGKVFKVAL